MILVLDLDDTLYPEATYVDSGFAAVASFLAPRLDAPADRIHGMLREALAADGRGHVFDTVIQGCTGAAPDPALVAACVETYRAHPPSIALADDVRALLDDLAARLPLYLVTDGDPEVQQRKIDALGIAPFFRECLRTWSFGREAGKPSLHCFELIRRREDVEWSDLVYVGDDPSKDFVALRRVGAGTVRVLTGRCRHVAADPDHDADVTIADVTRLPDVLREWEA